MLAGQVPVIPSAEPAAPSVPGPAAVHAPRPEEEPEEQESFARESSDNAVSEPEEDLSIAHASAELIRKALERTGGNRKAAAKALGISERNLYRKIESLGL